MVCLCMTLFVVVVCGRLFCRMGVKKRETGSEVHQKSTCVFEKGKWTTWCNTKYVSQGCSKVQVVLSRLPLIFAYHGLPFLPWYLGKCRFVSEDIKFNSFSNVMFNTLFCYSVITSCIWIAEHGKYSPSLTALRRLNPLKLKCFCSGFPPLKHFHTRNVAFSAFKL